MKIFANSRFSALVVLAVLLSGCNSEEEPEQSLPVISISNFGNAERVETLDISVNMFGTAVSDEKVTSVSWKNDRGGNGTAAGTENWAIGRIQLQYGANNVTLTAKDSLGNTNSRKITIERRRQNGTAANNAPTVSGVAPGTAAVNVAYDFRPFAADPDGDLLSFSIVNKPSWAEFDASSGRLYGVPHTADTGVHGDIRISVSDGAATATMKSFAIRVEAIGVGVATVNWTAPTERADDTPLTDLAGFEIHYGLSSGDFNSLITVRNPGLATYMVEQLPSGTWKFMVKAFDSAGRTSAPSNVGLKTIP